MSGDVGVSGDGDVDGAGAAGGVPALEVRDLVREYVQRVPAGRFRRRRVVVRAVDGLSLRVGRGESVGFIGANGAGKSTTVKLLTGILVPTAGTVRTCGLDPAARRR